MQVCDALVAVHAAGVVHRDLKPSNIFLSDVPPPSGGGSPPGGDVRVKLIDFGIARVEWEETRITNMGAPVGTPGYMAPEQEMGGEIDARSDMFAFGAVMYECLIGKPPPPSKPVSWRPPSSRPGRTDGDRISASGIHPATRALPVAWQALLSRAMAPAPADRFPDARSVLQALRELATVPAAEPLPTEKRGSQPDR